MTVSVVRSEKRMPRAAAGPPEPRCLRLRSRPSPPAPMAIPTVAEGGAGASLILSPTIIVGARSFSAFTTVTLSAGAASATIVSILSALSNARSRGSIVTSQHDNADRPADRRSASAPGASGCIASPKTSTASRLSWTAVETMSACCPSYRLRACCAHCGCWRSPRTSFRVSARISVASTRPSSRSREFAHVDWMRKCEPCDTGVGDLSIRPERDAMPAPVMPASYVVKKNAVDGRKLTPRTSRSSPTAISSAATVFGVSWRRGAPRAVICLSAP